MDFGLPFLTETETQEACVDVCKSLGLQFIELNMNFPQCQLSQLSADKLNCIRKETGLYFTIHLEESLDICHFNDKVRQAYLETVDQTIEIAKQIEAPIINMHLAKGIFITLPDKKEFLYETFSQDYLKSIREFRTFCGQALGDCGIVIAIENTTGFEIYEKEALEILLESKCFGLTLDIGHNHSAKNIDLPLFEKHRDKLVHMHAHDAKGKSHHLAFGQGEIDLTKYLTMAKQSKARVVLETKTIAALTQSLEYKKLYLDGFI